MLYNDYENLKKLEELLKNGAITQEEFEKEKAKILSKEKPESNPEKVETKFLPDLGMDENLYLLLMHLSQFITSFILPLIMWIVGKDKSQRVDFHGKEIMNFEISCIIWIIVGIITIPIIIGIVILSLVGIFMTVCIIVAAIKAFNGENWNYPLTIKFLK
jgi:uncharacterized Tic20 family protein